MNPDKLRRAGIRLTEVHEAIERDLRNWRKAGLADMEALARKDRSKVTRIMIDETIARRGHRYVTVVLDADHRG